MKTNQVENERKKKPAIPATVQPVEEDLDMFSDGGDAGIADDLETYFRLPWSTFLPVNRRVGQ